MISNKDNAIYSNDNRIIQDNNNNNNLEVKTLEQITYKSNNISTSSKIHNYNSNNNNNIHNGVNLELCDIITNFVNKNKNKGKKFYSDYVFKLLDNYPVPNYASNYVNINFLHLHQDDRPYFTLTSELGQCILYGLIKVPLALRFKKDDQYIIDINKRMFMKYNMNNNQDSYKTNENNNYRHNNNIKYIDHSNSKTYDTYNDPISDSNSKKYKYKYR